MGRLILVILILGALAAAAYFFILARVNKVSFQLSFKNLDLSNISLENIINAQATLKVQVNAKITNRNDFAIKLSDFHVWIYYAGTMLAQTADTEVNLKKVVIPANGIVDVMHDVTVVVNRNWWQIVKDLKEGKELKFDYRTEFNVFGFPYHYDDYFTYKR